MALPWHAGKCNNIADTPIDDRRGARIFSSSAAWLGIRERVVEYMPLRSRFHSKKLILLELIGQDLCRRFFLGTLPSGDCAFSNGNSA